MMLAKRNVFISRLFAIVLKRILAKRFHEIIVDEIPIRKDHSVLLLCNHFSWWDGFLAGHLIDSYFHKNFHIMMQEDHLVKRKWLRNLGGFSIKKSSRESFKSLQYAAELLNDSQNAVVLFPQGALNSMHCEQIDLAKGYEYLIKNIKGNCQIIFAANVVDYFESFKPSVQMSLLDCGTNHNIDFEKLSALINAHYTAAKKKQIRLS
jgi:1-acyl-sn-glycerol-3-phosphate acyltransferase